MEEELPFKFKLFELITTLVSLVFFVLDVVLDVYAILSFYHQEEYVVVGFLVSLLLGSSVLAQMYSLLWYSYDNYKMHTKKLQLCVNKPFLKILHVLQMGVFLRFAGVLEISMLSRRTGESYEQGIAVFLSHDLRMLRTIEAFSESAPQIILMLTIIIQNGGMEFITFLKTAGSVSAIAMSVTAYHRSLREFLPDKAKQGWGSTVVYFLWNMLLISTRIAALVLFASALPCYIAAHFLSLWMILFFCAWKSKTDFMGEGNIGGEWLFRATVGLIWYFSWFNVTAGPTRGRTLLYYTFITIDCSLLCGLWYWQITTDPPFFDFPVPPHVVFIGMAVLFIAGLVFRLIYYRHFHPRHTAVELEQKQVKEEMPPQGEDEVDFRMMASQAQGEDEVDSRPKPPTVNKRMMNLAANFYT